MIQSPMLSCPLKQTNEIDWVRPLKDYIRQSYGEDPERYSPECATLHRLRQDMRGAGKDSATGRDLLYRYYGQLELLDLRFPVDENHIKISFTWYDAFTHKPTAQYSLAYEKASIIFNISAVLSCHAADQNRAEDAGLKSAYHSFQASAGMFTYINENFLHAPSTDLNRETVKTLINITLAQAQEVFLEKQVVDEKKPGFLAKLASQTAYLYIQAAEGMQDYVSKGIFEKVWSIVIQAKAAHMASVASYYQAIADSQANQHGVAIGRLQLAEKQSATALGWAKSFPSTVSANSNLSTESGSSLMDLIKYHLAVVQSNLTTFTKDNDFIYHQPVPTEAGLSAVAKLPAAKAIPVSELYQGQDIQRIIGPDIFQKLVPMSVTETASLYDEEKAKLIRAETEKVETANGEMAASLDYLKLPGSLNILKGGMDQEMTVDDEFRQWCQELAGHKPFTKEFDSLQERKSDVLAQLDHCSKQLDLEESVCEKMRSKYGADWSQQPSARLNTTPRGDIRSYRDTVYEASASDSQLLGTLRQYEADFDEMRSAGEMDEADVLYQRAILKAGSKHGKSKSGTGSPYSSTPEGNLLDDVDEGSLSVADQISRVESILKKLNLVKRERSQVLKDLKEKVHTDDISNVLILNKKSITGQEGQLFEAELEKFRPHQNRLLQANHKQASLMKELTKIYGDLLQDKRVRAEQSKYETITRQRNTVMGRYKKVYDAFNGLLSGIVQAQTFYTEMGETVDSLKKNVETFINNRRSEGAQLLSYIERDKASGATDQEDREREKLRQLMERLSTDPKSSSASASAASKSPLSSTQTPAAYPSVLSSPPHFPAIPGQPPPPPPQQQQQHQQQQQQQPPPPSIPPSHSPASYAQYMNPGTTGVSYLPNQPFQQGAAAPLSEGYNPMAYPFQTPVSPPPNQFYSSTPAAAVSPYNHPHHYPGPSNPSPAPSQYMPPGYVPPPPPPRPQQTTAYPQSTGPFPSGPGGYAQSRPYGSSQHHRTQSQGPGPGQGPGQSSSSSDPWAGLNAWK